ncbi:hypothetical protein QYE76_023514 [Lolium multiflorum]|uniref:Myb/SANT-like domain-containing protein n=1 Tax=Lolium multiflorum TaxID=4521 RepID=A0AAD8RD14_LOLMU|nr:hypothetical protein QYE76_023514 [Lolium multiflorum]
MASGGGGTTGGSASRDDGADSQKRSDAKRPRHGRLYLTRTVGEACGGDGGCGGGYWPRRMVVFFVCVDDFGCGDGGAACIFHWDGAAGCIFARVPCFPYLGAVCGSFDSISMHSKQTMVWKPELSEFVLNRLVQLVRSGVCFNMGFKEQQMKKVAADVLAFAGVHVTTLQLYNHIRNWRTKWSVIMKMKSDRILDWRRWLLLLRR